MNLSPELLAALNTQYSRELGNHLMYLQLAAPLDAGNVFLGCASFLKRSAAEELTHAQLFYDHINDRNGLAAPVIASSPAILSLDDLSGTFEEALMAERNNSDALLALYELADTPTRIFLQPVITEQVRSERELTEIVCQLDTADDDMAALLEIDERLGKS
jgi:ferritin